MDASPTIAAVGEQPAGVLRERLPQRRLHLVGAGELRRLVHPRPDVEADRADQQPEDERDAPAPGLELVLGQPGVQAEAERRGQEHRQALGGHLPAGVERLAVGGVLDEERCGRAELATGGEALEQPRHEDDHAGPGADGGGVGANAMIAVPSIMSEDRQRQGLLAAGAVAVRRRSPWRRSGGSGRRSRTCAKVSDQARGAGLRSGRTAC